MLYNFRTIFHPYIKLYHYKLTLLFWQSEWVSPLACIARLPNLCKISPCITVYQCLNNSKTMFALCDFPRLCTVLFVRFNQTCRSFRRLVQEPWKGTYTWTQKTTDNVFNSCFTSRLWLCIKSHTSTVEFVHCGLPVIRMSYFNHTVKYAIMQFRTQPLESQLFALSHHCRYKQVIWTKTKMVPTVLWGHYNE